MHLIAQTYSQVELQQARSELEKRGIRVHVSDEFTYAIPGMPGAEQPLGIWVALAEDILPAQRVVSDLLGPDSLTAVDESPDNAAATGAARSGSLFSMLRRWRWVTWVALSGALWVIWRNL